MPHGHGQRGVRSRLGRQPFVGELGIVRIIGADRDNLGALVTDLGHEVRIRGPGHGNVGPPHHQVGGVPPVPGLGNVRLVPEHLRTGYRKVGIPVVERGHDPTNELDKPGTGGMRDHGHRRNRREPGTPVRPVGLDRVDVRGRRHFDGLLPRNPHQPALPPCLLVAATPFRVRHHIRPGKHRVLQAPLRLAVHLHQHCTGIGVAHAGGRIRVPRERRSPRAAARLVLRAVRAHARVVCLLRFPGDDPVLDIHLPGTGPRTVHPVGGADHLVMAPPVTIENIALAAALAENRAAIVGFVPLREKTAKLQQCIRCGSIQPRSNVFGGHANTLGRTRPESYRYGISQDKDPLITQREYL